MPELRKVRQENQVEDQTGCVCMAVCLSIIMMIIANVLKFLKNNKAMLTEIQGIYMSIVTTENWM